MQQSLVINIINYRYNINYIIYLFLQNVLHDVPDYEDRKKILESLKNRLEALLVPKLTAAFNEHCTSMLISPIIILLLLLLL